jgi:phosphate transport system substrate-binding protein
MRALSLKFALSAVILSFVLAACTPAAAPAAPAPAEPAAAPVEPTAAPTEAPAEPAAPAVETEAPAAEGIELPDIDPASVSGNIITAGSSTVFPLAEVMAERFKDEGFPGEITIDSIGSGAGYERFCKAGETDISNASRAIKDSEVESCAAIGRKPIEFRVGTDALAVVVSSDNDFVTDVTLEELAMIFSSKATKWSDVRADWPAEDILRFSPGTDSGTFDFFIEGVMAPANKNAEGKADMKAGQKDFLDAANLQLSEDDNVLVQGVQGSKYAVGYFGFAYFAENQATLNAISLEGVAPSFESAEANTYKLARPLFIYSDAKIMAEKPQVAAFINFFLSYVDEEIESVGYFPASVEALDGAKQAWLDAQN